jgi:hypothetical protein
VTQRLAELEQQETNKQINQFGDRQHTHTQEQMAMFVFVVVHKYHRPFRLFQINSTTYNTPCAIVDMHVAL